MYHHDSQQRGCAPGVHSGGLRDAIADYELIRAWDGPGRRHVAHPPGRLRLEGPVVVSELAVDAEGWQALCDRLARLARVPGDGLLEVIEVGPDLDTGTVFLVTERAERMTGRPVPAEAARLVAGAARAMHAMHEAGLTYGPLTADSILVADRGPVLDLPQVDAVAGEIVDRATWESLQTAEPEILGGEAPSRGSDIWSIGAVLHSLLTERPLYPGIEGDETVTAVQRVLFTRPEPDGAIAGPFLSLIEACLEGDPADRPVSALAVAERLESMAAP